MAGLDPRCAGEAGGRAGRCGLPQAQMESHLIFLPFLLIQKLFIASQSWAEMVSPKPCLVCWRTSDRKRSPLGEEAALGLWKRVVQLPLLHQGPCKTPVPAPAPPLRGLSPHFCRDARQLQRDCYMFELRWVAFPPQCANHSASPRGSAYTWIQVQEVYLGGDTWRNGKGGREEVRRGSEGGQSRA